MPNTNNFPILDTVIRHVCVDTPTYLAFVDWLGFIIQHRIATNQGWIFQGTQGSGKTFLLRTVLRKLFPNDMLAITSGEYMPTAKNLPLLVFADEATEKQLRNPRFSHAIKKMITSETTNLVMAAATPIKNSIIGARRLTISPYQHKALPLDQSTLRLALDSEMPDLISYLQSLDVQSTLS